MAVKNNLICNCVTYGLCLNNAMGKKIKKMWNKQFWESTNYKNEYIKFCWDAINMYANEDMHYILYKIRINYLVNQYLKVTYLKRLLMHQVI